MSGKKILQYNKYGKYILVILISTLLSPYIHSQQPEFNFEHIRVDNGVTEPAASWIIQDSRGYLWFSCDDIIARYDGYSLISYKHELNDKLKGKNSFTVPYEDKAGILWIGTNNGLEKLDRTTGRFTHYTPNPSDTENNYSNIVLSICEDKYGVLWVGTIKGLYKFDRSTGKFTRLVSDSTDPGSIYHNEINTIYEDEQGDLWFGTGGGLDKLDYKTGKFLHYWNTPENQKKNSEIASKFCINSICEDDDGTIWLGTNWGIVEFNRNSDTFNNYLPNPGLQAAMVANSIASVNDNSIDDICLGRGNVLWFGNWNGLYGFDIKSKNFVYHYVHDVNKPGSISHNKVVSLFAEQSGTIWAGTLNGVNKFNPIKKIFKVNLPEGVFHYFMEVNGVLYIKTSKAWFRYNPITKSYFPHSFGTDKLYWIEESGSSWFRDKKGNLYKKDIKGNITYFHTPSGELFNAPLICFFIGTKGIWMGASKGNGVYFLDTTTQIVCEFKKIKGYTDIIYEDSFGLVWIVPYGKLLCYNQEKDTLKEYISEPGISGSISGQQVTKIMEDKKNRLWFATNKGLNRFDHSTGMFIHFTETNYPSDNNIVNMLEDDHGYLWLAKTTSISKFDPEKNSFQNFNIPSGINLISFIYRAIKRANGEMYFGGLNGLIHFHPDSLRINSFIPPVVITSFRKFGKPFPVKKEIHLPYDENFISFEFSALSYINPEKNQYAYMLQGLDKNWIYSGTRRYASYTNLNPGKYLFKVKGSNNDGVWNENGTSISIIISPPWWKTLWAYILYTLLILSIIHFTWKLQVKRIKMRHEYEMSRFEAEKLSELDELKSRFFANISHEFRTPLTLILGPVKQIIDRIRDEKTKNELKVVHRNAASLLGLVNQLLDISKLESGKMKLQTAPQNIIPLLKALVYSFSSYAERKSITLKFNSSGEEIIAYIDKDKIEKIINNILSNAFKYTSEGGLIEVNVSLSNFYSSSILNNRDLKVPSSGGDLGVGKKEFIQITVRDTGIGIPKEKIPKIFDRFYQVNGGRKREHEGTGIGLALTKELIELHKGTIRVKSEKGQGTKFTVFIPLGKEHLNPKEIADPVNVEREIANVAMKEISIDESTVETDLDLITEKEKQILLIVEDNTDVRNYIKDNLKEDYNILEAADGEEGLDKSFNHIPDLIISDVMMPKMDGFELCKKIKEDERTSHIPVIMLTAKASDSDKIGGYERGADDYIMKPFEIAELKVRIKNLIEQRKRIHEHFRKHGLIEIELSDITSTDKRFLQRAFDIINKNISDTAFGIESLSELLGTSRSVLHRKITSLTGESPGELIRKIRLKKASQLIKQNFGNISEISLEVGFNNPSQFTRSFRKQFGVSPSLYQQNHKNKSN